MDFLVVTPEMRDWGKRSFRLRYCSNCGVVHLFTPRDADGRCAKGQGWRLRGWIRDLESEPLDVVGLLNLHGEAVRRWSPLRLKLHNDWKRQKQNWTWRRLR